MKAKGKTTESVRAKKVTYKEKGGKEDLTMEDIGKPLTFDKPHATVRVSQGVTLNMGNYQSLRLAVDISLPCAPEHSEKAFTLASKFVEQHLAELVMQNKGSVQQEEQQDDDGDFNL